MIEFANQLSSISLEDLGDKLKKAVISGRNAPLATAQLVIDVGSNWDALKSQTDAATYTAWLKQVSDYQYVWWASRAEAVTKLGKWSARQLDHGVANYVARNVPADKLESVCFMLRRACDEHGGIPISKAAAMPKIYNLLGKKPSKSAGCAECARLRKILLEHGISEPL
jgi:hypothetical protein